MARIRILFGIDLRTLALFRILLAGVVIADLIGRARDLSAHYTDTGILPRADLIGHLGQWQPSLHFASGSAAGQALLFFGAGLAALSLLVGYRTRAATVISWLFLVSLQARNELIAQGGDSLLSMLLFWGMFLPLGARASIDAALDRTVAAEPNAYCSVATAALLIQCMSVYFFSALLKSGPAWIPDGTAVYYALHIDYLATPIAVWLRQFPGLMTALTYYVWYLELIGPWLMFSPFIHVPLRLVVMVLLISMHIGFFLCLEIGIFPFISIASLLAFTPGSVWDRLATMTHSAKRDMLVYFDGPCEFCQKVCLILRSLLLLPGVRIQAAQEVPEIHRQMREHNSWVIVDHDGSSHVRFGAVALMFKRSPIFAPLGLLFGSALLRRPGDAIYELVARNRARLGALTAWLLPFRDRHIHPSLVTSAFVGVAMLFVFYINLSTLPGFAWRLPPGWDAWRDTLHLAQKWNMFTPEPPRYDGWYVVRGESRDGTIVDVLRERIGEPDWTRPHYLAREYPNYRWRKYLIGLAHSDYAVVRPYYANYLCRRWNERRALEKRLVEVKLYFNVERVQPNYQPRTAERLLLHVQTCQTSTARPSGRRPLTAEDQV